MYGDMPFDYAGPSEGPVLVIYSMVVVSTCAVYSVLAMLIASGIKKDGSAGCSSAFAYVLIPVVWNLFLCMFLLNTYSIEFHWILLIIAALVLSPWLGFSLVWELFNIKQKLPGGVIASIVLGFLCLIPAMVTPEAHDPFFENLVNAEMVSSNEYRWAQMVRKNSRKADKLDWEVIKKWLDKAESGDPKAMEIVASHYSYLEGMEGYAFHWWRKAAEAGNMDAQFALGMHYKIGRIIGQDLEKSRYWLLNAKEQGRRLPSEAQYILDAGEADETSK